MLATIRAEQDLRRRGIDLASEEGRAIVANAVRVQQLTTELQRQEATQRALQGAIGNALDRFGTLLAQGKTDWKSWADAGQAAINDIMNELIKLAVMNPLKNFLFGGNAPTLATCGGIFGELGKIFAGCSMRAGWSVRVGRAATCRRSCSQARRAFMAAATSGRARCRPSCKPASAC